MVKMVSDTSKFSGEVKATKSIASENTIGMKQSNPQVLGYGLAEFKGKTMAWSVMPRYLMDLENYFKIMTNLISEKSICAIGIAMLNLLEGVHKAGYVFNNLKPERIMLGRGPY